MQKTPAARSAFSWPRVLICLVLFAIGGLIAALRVAASAPSSGSRLQNISRTPAAGLARPAALDALRSLQDAAHLEMVTRVSRATGNYGFVSAPKGSLLAKDDSTATPRTRALAFLANHGALVGLNDAERAGARSGTPPANGSSLSVLQSDTDKIGTTHVRLEQSYQNLPVFGAQLVVHMNSRGITAVNGDYVSGISVSTLPALTQKGADEIAVASQRNRTGKTLKAEKTELAIYATGLLEGKPVRSVLAYAVAVSGGEQLEQVWVDAQTGAILSVIPLDQSALFRIIYSPRYDPANPTLFIQRSEGDPPHPLPFVNNLYDFAGQTYNFYASAFGRDAYDGLGHIMRSVYLINEQCPNAYWNGESTNYCPIFDADDVVSHEWSHAYTQFTHGLIYAFQSGALNESYSDIFGESVDLLNGADGQGGGNNAEPYPNGQRWLVGEDLGSEVQELLLRDMYDPDRLGDPGKVSSPNYACGTADGGGVHTNSGVPNHAFALIVDGTQFAPGGAYNGQTITGIGMTKAAAIYYRAESVYQTPTTDFAAHDVALQTSCSDLTGAQLKDPSTNSPVGATSSEVITAADCQQVAKAMLAVEMSSTPPCSYGPLLSPDAPPICPGANIIFSEDWESGEDGWTKTSMGYLTGLIDWEDASKANTRFFHVVSALPGDRAGSAAFAINPPVGQEGGGTCAPGGDYSGSHTLNSPQIVIPAGATAPQLAFDHYVVTEAGVDGGQVEVSVNGGAFALLPRSEYVFNPPNTKFNDAAPVGNNTGPNPGEDAWTGMNLGGPVQGSWGTTVANLSSVAQPGDTIQIRFTWSQDGCNGVVGWYVDNIRVFNCPLLEAPVLSTGSDYENPDTDGRFTLNWTRPTGAVGPDVLQESQSSCAPIIFDDAENGLANWTTTTTGTGAMDWTTSTAKPQHTGTTFFAQGLEGITSADSYMTYNAPIGIPATGQTFLTFSDWDNNEGDDNVIVEASADNGTTWVPVYTHNRSEAGTGPASFATEPLFNRSVNLANYGGQTIHLRFHYSLGADNRAGSTPLGWYVDDIAIVNDTWTDVANTSDTSSLQVRGTGTYCYRVHSVYNLSGDIVSSPYSNTVSVTVAPGVTPPPTPTPTPSGSATPTATPGGTTTPTATPGGSATPTATPRPAQLLNISTRLRVQTGNNVLIGGFIVTGSDSKKVLVLAKGPSISAGGTPLPGRLADPVLELRDGSGAVVATNDNWRDSPQRTEIANSGAAPTDDLESAILRTLAPGNYTAVVSGLNNTTGVALVETFDLDQAANSRLANISTRGFVETADNVMIGGFITGPASGTDPGIVVRAVGPSLSAFGLSNVLADPVLELHDANGATFATNDDWLTDPNAALVLAAGLAPSDAKESAIYFKRPASAYTAIVSGKNNTTGIGLVETYNIQ